LNYSSGVTSPSRADLTVVIPTYNERDRLAELVTRLFDAARDSRITLELVVVDDNSPDGTGQVAEIQGEYGESRQRYLDALDSFASLGDRFRVAETEHHQCRLALAEGNLSEAETHLARARDPAGAAVIATDIAWDAATLRLAQGRVDDAVAELRGFEKRQPVGDLHGKVRLARVRGRVLEAQGRREEALKRFLWAAEAAKESGADLEEARSLLCAATCAASFEEKEAKRCALEAVRLFDKHAIPDRCRRPEL